MNTRDLANDPSRILRALEEATDAERMSLTLALALDAKQRGWSHALSVVAAMVQRREET